MSPEQVDRVILSLAHLPRDVAIAMVASWVPDSVVLSWFDTFTAPADDNAARPDEAILIRAATVSRDMGIQVRVTRTRDTAINHDKNSTELFLHFIKEMLP